MIEEIKKEIKEVYMNCDSDGDFESCELLDKINKILDKYNQPDYKSAFDEIFEKSHYKNITMEDMIELYKKYNLGGE